jgi:hypothetical protein
MLLGMIGVFLPSVAVEVGGVALSHRAEVSLYRAESNREVVRKWLASYGRSGGKRIGGALLPVLLPHTHGAINDHLDDVNSAMDTLKDVHDDDVKTAGVVLQVLLWGFLGLHVLAGGLVLRGLVSGREHRGGALAVAAVVTVIVGLVGVGLYFAWGAAVFEINDEIGKEVVGLAIGAYVSPVAAIGMLVAMAVLVVRQLRLKSRA